MAEPDAEPGAGSWRRLLDGARRRLADATRVFSFGAVVPVHVRVAQEQAVPEDDPLVGELRSSVARVVKDHVQALGIPGRADVQVAVEPSDADDPLRLSVHGRWCRAATGTLNAIVAELTHGQAKGLGDVPRPSLPEVVAAACSVALQRQLSVLASREQLDLVLLGAGFPLGTPDPTQHAALRRGLDQGVSVGDRKTLAAALRDAAGQSSAELAEALVERLRPSSLDLLMTEQTLRRVTTAEPEQSGAVRELRTRLFDDLGVQLPDIRFAEASMPEGTCAFRLNSVTTWPRAIPDVSPISHLCRRLDAAVRARASWFVSMADLRDSLDQLSLVFPDRVGAARERYSLQWLSAVARCLVEEGVSIRDLSTLLDRLLDLDDPGTRPDVVRLAEGPATTRDGAWRPPPRDVVALVRQRVREAAWAVAPGVELQPAHRLPEELAFAGNDERREEDEQAAFELLSEAVRPLVESGRLGIPLVVSSVPARSRVREALAAFPELEVVASQEYPAWVRLVPPPPVT